MYFLLPSPSEISFLPLFQGSTATTTIAITIFLSLFWFQSPGVTILVSPLLLIRRHHQHHRHLLPSLHEASPSFLLNPQPLPPTHQLFLQPKPLSFPLSLDCHQHHISRLLLWSSSSSLLLLNDHQQRHHLSFSISLPSLRFSNPWPSSVILSISCILTTVCGTNWIGQHHLLPRFPFLAATSIALLFFSLHHRASYFWSWHSAASPENLLNFIDCALLLARTGWPWKWQAAVVAPKHSHHQQHPLLFWVNQQQQRSTLSSPDPLLLMFDA